MLTVADADIKIMVDRFLNWKLPADFIPDAGISFRAEYNVEWNEKQGRAPDRYQPTGTNLFNATQAEAMIRHLLGETTP